MIYFLGVVVSTICTIVLGLLFYFSDEDITIGNLVFGLFICCMSWIAVIGYIAILLAAGIDFLIHRDFWMKTIFTRNEKHESDEDDE